MVMPASAGAAAAVAPTTSAAADTVPLSKKGAPSPTAIGLSVGFGATEPGGFKP
jgi:hypothetical protein